MLNALNIQKTYVYFIIHRNTNFTRYLNRNWKTLAKGRF